MYNIIKNKESILKLVGSFYYSVMKGDASKQAGKLTYIPFHTSAFQKVDNLIQLLLGKSYLLDEHFTIDLKPSNLFYGIKTDTQEYDEVEFTLLGNLNLQNLTLEANQEVVYKITFDKDVLISTIQPKNTTILYQNVDFVSKFGEIILKLSPIELFSDNKIRVITCIRRFPNILCYPLGLDHIYGSVDRVQTYYKDSQAPIQFKYALLQAMGFPVVKEDDVIVNKLNTQQGVVYITDKGHTYTADFQHSHLNTGDIVKKDQVIGIADLLQVILPDEDMDDTISEIHFNGGRVTGGKDIIIPNATVLIYQDGLFQPSNFITGGEGKPSYINFINTIGPAEQLQYFKDNNIENINAIEFFRNVILAFRSIIVLYSETLPEYMQLRMRNFIQNHSPVGSTIVVSKQVKT